MIHERTAAILALDIAHEHAETVDGEWGCMHTRADWENGVRLPRYEGDEAEPIPATCAYTETMTRHIQRIEAALGVQIVTRPETPNNQTETQLEGNTATS